MTGPDRDGRLRVTIPIESLEHAVPELLRLGPDAEVVGPPELRARLVETLTAMRAAYGDA